MLMPSLLSPTAISPDIRSNFYLHQTNVDPYIDPSFANTYTLDHANQPKSTLSTSQKNGPESPIKEGSDESI